MSTNGARHGFFVFFRKGRMKRAVFLYKSTELFFC